MRVRESRLAREQSNHQTDNTDHQLFHWNGYLHNHWVFVGFAFAAGLDFDAGFATLVGGFAPGGGSG